MDNGHTDTQQSFFAQCIQFAPVDNELIATEPFLNASRDIVRFVEFLGTVFSPVKSDINGNITKLTAFVDEDRNKFQYLHQIVESERELIAASEFAIGTDALLWLSRAIEYIKVFLTQFTQDYKLRLLHRNNQTANATKIKERDVSELFQLAYEATLKKYHGWFVQKIFSACLYAAPSRSQLLKLLSSTKGIRMCSV